ncbi:MAG: hypothetical protein R6U51_06195 [Anaerolineales bacterium]
MSTYHIRIVGGWCGNRMVMVQDHLSQLLKQHGYQVSIDQQSIWENYAPPQRADLVLQMIPAFQPEDLVCPSLAVRPFIRDLDDQKTLQKIFSLLEEHYPQVTDLPAGSNPFADLEREKA